MSTQPLTSRVVERVTPAAQPFTFPGIFRSKLTGNHWIASRRGYALRLSVLSTVLDPRADIPGYVGDTIGSTCALGGEINETEYVQVTGPVTIEFNPSQSHFI